MEHPSVYVASPLGFTEAGRRYLAGFLHPALEQAGFSILDPWSDPDGVVTATMAIEPSDPGRLAALAEMNRTLGKANAAAIAAADVLLAVLDGADVDSGTASEVGYAAGIGVPVVGYRTDLRTSGDNEAATVNLQVEYFVEASGGAIHTTLATAIEAVMSAARPVPLPPRPPSARGTRRAFPAPTPPRRSIKPSTRLDSSTSPSPTSSPRPLDGTTTTSTRPGWCCSPSTVEDSAPACSSSSPPAPGTPSPISTAR